MENDQGGVAIDGDYVVLRFHKDRLHGLRVALQRCGCIAAKSAATDRTKTYFLTKLDQALGKLQEVVGV